MKHSQDIFDKLEIFHQDKGILTEDLIDYFIIKNNLHLSQIEQVYDKIITMNWDKKKSNLINDVVNILSKTDFFELDFDNLRKIFFPYVNDIKLNYSTLYYFLQSSDFAKYKNNINSYFAKLISNEIKNFISTAGKIPECDIALDWFIIGNLPLISELQVNNLLNFGNINGAKNLATTDKILDDVIDDNNRTIKDFFVQENEPLIDENYLIKDLLLLYQYFNDKPFETKTLELIISSDSGVTGDSSVADLLLLNDKDLINFSGFGHDKIWHFNNMKSTSIPLLLKVLKGIIEFEKSYQLNELYNEKLLISCELIYSKDNKNFINRAEENAIEFFMQKSEIGVENIKLEDFTTTITILNLLTQKNVNDTRILELVKLKKQLYNYYRNNDVVTSFREQFEEEYYNFQVSYFAVPTKIRNMVLRNRKESAPTLKFFLNLQRDFFCGTKVALWDNFHTKIIDTIETFPASLANNFLRTNYTDDISLDLLDYYLNKDLQLFFSNENHDRIFSKNNNYFSENNIEMFKKRIGFKLDKLLTLEEISSNESNKITRERIRQITSVLFSHFKWLTTIPPATIKNVLEKYPKKILLNKKTFPLLYERFNYNTNSVKSFLRDLCAVEYKNYEGKFLNEFWKEKFTTATKEEIISFIAGNSDNNDDNYDVELATKFFEIICEEGYLRKTTDAKYLPQKMSAADAISFVLRMFPLGLKWKEARNIANKLTLTKSPINKDIEYRPTIIFSENDNIYLAKIGIDNRAIYKHISEFYKKCSLEEIYKYMIELKIYLETNSNGIIDLETYHRTNAHDIDYYILRQAIRLHANEYGLVWDGASRKDNVRLSSTTASPITNKTKILDYIYSNVNGVNINEIIENTHIRMQVIFTSLSSLTRENEVMKLTNSIYISTANGLSIIKDKIDDIKVILNHIFNKQENANYIIESCYLSKVINRELGTNYHKAFATSITKIFATELRLNYNYTLFSRNVLQYASLIEILRQNCNIETDNFTLEKTLRTIIKTTDKMYMIMIRNFKSGIWK